MNSRRDFLKTSSLLAMGFMGLNTFAKNPLKWLEASSSAGYGPLIPDPKGIMNLPKGFSYKIISEYGSKMADGLLLPNRADGMAAFRVRGGKVAVIRNHELSPNEPENGAFGEDYRLLSKLNSKDIYDFGKGKQPGLGGTSTFMFDEDKQEIEMEYMSLAGTFRNCAGGRTPWNSWITCEEDVTKKGNVFEKDHGYNFEVPVSLSGKIAKPIPLTAMGRFNHEAVGVDPRTGIVYQTEDRHEGLIYRFIPKKIGKLHKGGKLQALVIKGIKSCDTRNWDDSGKPSLEIGKQYEVEWMDLEDIDSPEDDLRLRGNTAGAAKFARGEGCWFGEQEVFWACTNGGKNKKGQIFRYRLSPYEGTDRENEKPATVEIFAEPNDTEILKSADNLTQAPWGDLVICEDDPHPFLVGITMKGEIYKLGENVGYESELTGACFSPSGKTLFVNIQHAGLTLAITGPWT